MSALNVAKVAAIAASPANTPERRTTTTALPRASSGTKASVVQSPRGPMSSRTAKARIRSQSCSRSSFQTDWRNSLFIDDEG